MEKRAADAGTSLRPDAFVFSGSPDGSTFWNPPRVTEKFSKARDRLGLPKTDHLHGLRHHHGSALISLGVDVRTVAGRLGHSNPSTTLSVYAHFSPVADRQAAQLFSQSRYALPGMGELTKGTDENAARVIEERLVKGNDNG